MLDTTKPIKPQLDAILANKELLTRFKGYINQTPLSDKERKMVIYRMGLEDSTLHTLEETGKMFGVTRERIRQIEAKTLEKMRVFWGKKLSTFDPIDKKLTEE